MDVITVQFQGKNREELLQSLARLETILAQTPAVIYTYKMVAGKRVFTYVNENIVNILGLKAEEVIRDPESWTRQVHPQDLTLIATEPGQPTTGRPIYWNIALIVGQVIIVGCRKNKMLLLMRGETEIVAICWDVTEQKLSEEKFAI